MGVAPGAVVEPGVVAVERRPVVDALVAEQLAELGQPVRVGGDEREPDVVPELVADVAERGAVVLAQRGADHLPAGRVRFVEVERDLTAAVPDDGRVTG